MRPSNATELTNDKIFLFLLCVPVQYHVFAAAAASAALFLIIVLRLYMLFLCMYGFRCLVWRYILAYYE